MSGQATVLVVDDERNVRRTLGMVLEDEGYRVETFERAEPALERLERGRVDVLLLDVQLPGMSGIEALRRLAEGGLEVPTIVISGNATLSEAVEATRLGAYDFLEKPLDRDRVLLSVRNCLERRDLAREVRCLRDRVAGLDEMIGESRAMAELRAAVAKVAPTRGRVLVTGESGTGKELVARELHRASDRAARPFVRVNCAAIPADLIESELFGHERGAFTGASARRRGQFVLADGGTLLLDEIGDMTPGVQAKVLRALQTGEVRPVGGERDRIVDVRVIAATNKDLKAAVAAGDFREDLYFRLAVVPLRAPPLRERTGDVPLLVRHFVAAFSRENHEPPRALTPRAMASLDAYSWPGNVRELKNVCERLVIMGGDPIDVPDLPEELAEPGPRFEPSRHGLLPLREFREAVEREYLEHVLGRSDWNVTRAAAAIGVERTNLHKKMRAYGLSRS